MNVFSGNSCRYFFLSSSVCQRIVPKERRLSNSGTRNNQNMLSGTQELQRKKEEFYVKNFLKEKNNPLEHTHTQTRTNHKDTCILPSHKCSLQGNTLFYKSPSIKSHFQ